MYAEIDKQAKESNSKESVPQIIENQGKNENLKVMIVSLYRLLSAYYSDRSAFCDKE